MVKYEFSHYITPNTLEVLPFLTINILEGEAGKQWCVMFGWLNIVFDLQVLKER